jgi:hypothetical protein
MEMGENLLHFCQNIDEGNVLAGKRVAHFLQMNIPPAVVGDKDPAAFCLTGALHLPSNQVQPFLYVQPLLSNFLLQQQPTIDRRRVVIGIGREERRGDGGVRRGGGGG